MSICDINYNNKEYGYGLLIEKEFNNIELICGDSKIKILKPCSNSKQPLSMTAFPFLLKTSVGVTTIFRLDNVAIVFSMGVIIP